MVDIRTCIPIKNTIVIIAAIIDIVNLIIINFVYSIARRIIPIAVNWVNIRIGISASIRVWCMKLIIGNLSLSIVIIT